MNKTELNLKKGNICITGDLTFDTVNQMWKDSQILLGKGERIGIDLTGVTRTDSAGLALLIEWFRYANKHCKSIVFKNIPIQLINMAKISGVDSILKINLLHDI